jgi:hypothetical protein
MKVRLLLLTAALFACLFAETVVKDSAPFPFPTVTGVLTNQLQHVSFVSKSQWMGANTIAFAWSIPANAKKGNITIYNVLGAQVKTFSLTAPQGMVEWDLSAGRTVASGIYFARLSYGSVTKNLTVVLYR